MDHPTVDLSLKVDTTKAKIRVLQSLQGYWRIKGKFLQNKLDPRYGPSNPDFYRDIASYISLYTDLPTRSGFWNELSEDKKAAFGRALIFSDEVPSKFKLRYDEANTTICIVLNGYASVESSFKPGKRTTYGQGQSFGECHHFDALTRFEHAGRPSYDPIVPFLGEGETLDVMVQKGALLKINIEQFRQIVWGHAPPEVDDDASNFDTRSDYEISGIAAEALTDADLACIKAHRIAKKRLASVLYDFMSSSDLLPKNAHAASAGGFLRKSDKGTFMYVNAHTVYIVLDGMLKLQIEKKGPLVRDGGLGTQIVDGEDVTEGIRVKMQRLPIMTLDVGTMAFLRDECYTVGQDGATLPSGVMKPQFRAALEQARIGTIYPAPQPSPPRKDKKGRLILDDFQTDTIYHLSLSFEKNTVYLAIPESKFRLAMEECPELTRESFQLQLEHFNDTTFARIVKLLPWIQGGTLGVHVPAREHLVRAGEEVHEPGPFTGIGFRSSNDDMLETSLKGSFRHITMLGSYDDDEQQQQETTTSSSMFLTTSASAPQLHS